MSGPTANQTIHLSQASLLMPFVQYLQGRGISVETHLLRAGIKPATLEEQSNLLSRRLMFKFINNICEEEEIEDIGLLVGQATSLQKMGTFGQWMLNAETVHAYLIRGCKVINQVSSGDYYWLKRERDHIRFCASVSSLDEKDMVQDYLYITLVTINTLSEALGRAWSPSEINIPHMSAQTNDGLSQVLPGTRISLKENHASFTVPNWLLKHPLTPGYQPSLDEDFPLPMDFIDSLKQLIKILVMEERPDICSAANATGISQRTLQRRLKNYGTNFTQLVTEVRIGMAKQWIQDQEYSITEVATRLGYNDPTNFSRAFRRVTGSSPRTYLRELKRHQ
jgi:AraC-like DNA-binding protein